MHIYKHLPWAKVKDEWDMENTLSGGDGDREKRVKVKQKFQ